jgi:hypothetical protein
MNGLEFFRCSVVLVLDRYLGSLQKKIVVFENTIAVFQLCLAGLQDLVTQAPSSK